MRPITLKQARAWLKPRPKNAHKGSAGRVLIIAGSRGMIGAGVLCTMGALRSGAGLVKLATVKSQQPIAAKRSPLEATTVGFPEDASGRLSDRAWPFIKRLIDHWKPDVIACGPGLGLSSSIIRLVGKLLQENHVRIVLDADGLNALAQLPTARASSPLVMTPHAGELARLLGTTAARVNSRREFFAKQAAVKFRCVCLLKGAGTLVTEGKTVWKNSSGNPAMATGGMGDVLTGVIAASWAQDFGPGLVPAALGAYVHGLAGDLARRNFPERSMLASDVADHLPMAYKKIWRKT